MDDPGWVTTECEVNLVITILERCPVKNIEWGNRRVVLFHTAQTGAAPFSSRPDNKNHLWQMVTGRVNVANGFIWFDKLATLWLGVWIEAHLTFQMHHNQCLGKAWAAEARLRTLTMIYRVRSESIRAVQVPFVQPVGRSGSELWCDPKEVGRRDDLQLTLN